MRLEGIRDPSVKMEQLKIGNSVLSQTGFKIMKNLYGTSVPLVKADSEEFLFTFVDAHAWRLIVSLSAVACLAVTF